MSNDFSAMTAVSGRKQHICECCGHMIPAGVRHLKVAGKWQGEFYAERMHDDCYTLWQAMFDDWGDPCYGMTFDLVEVLCDSGDKTAARDALNCNRGHFPHAVCRIEFRLRRWLGDAE